MSYTNRIFGACTFRSHIVKEIIEASDAEHQRKTLISISTFLSTAVAFVYAFLAAGDSFADWSPGLVTAMVPVIILGIIMITAFALIGFLLFITAFTIFLAIIGRFFGGTLSANQIKNISAFCLPILVLNKISLVIYFLFKEVIYELLLTDPGAAFLMVVLIRYPILIWYVLTIAINYSIGAELSRLKSIAILAISILVIIPFAPIIILIFLL